MAWYMHGKREMLKKYNLSMAIVEKNRVMYERGRCYRCITQDILKKCGDCNNEKDRKSWKEFEAEVFRKYGAVYDRGFTADDYHNVASGKISIEKLNNITPETPSSASPYSSGVLVTPTTVVSVPAAVSIPKTEPVFEAEPAPEAESVPEIEPMLEAEPTLESKSSMKSEDSTVEAVSGEDNRNEAMNISHTDSDNPLVETETVNDTPPGNVYEIGQNVFARWDNGESYFPGIISSVNGNQLDISFLDGDKGTVPIADVLELQEAFRTLKLYGNWQYGGEWYSGKIAKTEPLTMQYDDGEVEVIKLEQLQGVL